MSEFTSTKGTVAFNQGKYIANDRVQINLDILNRPTTVEYKSVATTDDFYDLLEKLLNVLPNDIKNQTPTPKSYIGAVSDDLCCLKFNNQKLPSKFVYSSADRYAHVDLCYRLATDYRFGRYSIVISYRDIAVALTTEIVVLAFTSLTNFWC